MSGKTFDLESVKTSPQAEDEGALMWFGGPEGEGVPFIVRYHLYKPFVLARSEREEKNAYLLRKNSPEAMQLREKIRCEEMAKNLIISWGDGIVFRGKTIHGADLSVKGEIIKWERGSSGGTSLAAQKKLSETLLNRNYRSLKESLIMFSMDDGNYEVYEESESAENLEESSDGSFGGEV